MGWIVCTIRIAGITFFFEIKNKKMSLKLFESESFHKWKSDLLSRFVQDPAQGRFQTDGKATLASLPRLVFAGRWWLNLYDGLCHRSSVDLLPPFPSLEEFDIDLNHWNPFTLNTSSDWLFSSK
jgi:hypothetical protein